MGHMITSRYNVVLVCLSLKQNITIFSLQSKPTTDVSLYRLICIGHVYGSHLFKYFLIYVVIFYILIRN